MHHPTAAITSYAPPHYLSQSPITTFSAVVSETETQRLRFGLLAQITHLAGRSFKPSSSPLQFHLPTLYKSSLLKSEPPRTIRSPKPSQAAPFSAIDSPKALPLTHYSIEHHYYPPLQTHPPSSRHCPP